MKIQRHLCCTVLLAGFLLGCFKGYLALWEDGSTEPKQIYPVKVSSLPEADQKILEQGIRAVTSGELNRLLEDYLS